MEYLVTYGWALLVLAIVLALIYVYSSSSLSYIPGSCAFSSGITCGDIVLGTNTITQVTTISLFLINSQQYPINSPVMYVRIGGKNTTTSACTPTFVLPGGSMVCTSPALPTNVALGVLSSGSLYVNATYCGLSNNYVSTGSCLGSSIQTYSGTFSAHAAPMLSTATYGIFVTARNLTQLAGTARDPVYALVQFFGYPMPGATVSFLTNNGLFNFQPLATTTNSTGNAIAYIWGNVVNTVIVTATFGTVSNTVSISFQATTSTTSTSTTSTSTT